MTDLSWPKIHSLFDGPADMGRVLGVSRQRGHQIIRNGWPIPSARWPRLLAWARANDHKQITAETLAQLPQAVQNPSIRSTSLT